MPTKQNIVHTASVLTSSYNWLYLFSSNYFLLKIIVTIICIITQVIRCEKIVVVVVLFIVIPKKEVAFVDQFLSQQGGIE